MTEGTIDCRECPFGSNCPYTNHVSGWRVKIKKVATSAEDKSVRLGFFDSKTQKGITYACPTTQFIKDKPEAQSGFFGYIPGDKVITINTKVKCEVSTWEEVFKNIYCVSDELKRSKKETCVPVRWDIYNYGWVEPEFISRIGESNFEHKLIDPEATHRFKIGEMIFKKQLGIEQQPCEVISWATFNRLVRYNIGDRKNGSVPYLLNGEALWDWEKNCIRASEITPGCISESKVTEKPTDYDHCDHCRCLLVGEQHADDCPQKRPVRRPPERAPLNIKARLTGGISGRSYDEKDIEWLRGEYTGHIKPKRRFDGDVYVD